MKDTVLPLLEVAGVSKSFGMVQALQDVSFDVRAGEVHGLVGENGAGKSTLMAVCSGAIAATHGNVQICGVPVDGDTELARNLGLAIVRQHPALMPDLTVAENLYLGVPEQKRPAMSQLGEWSIGLLRDWDETVSIQPADRVNSLNPEQLFIVEIVKALASDPKVLILDEPTEHLAVEDTERLFDRIKAEKSKGAAVVYISHRIHDVQAISDRLTVLRDGEGQGTFDAKTQTEEDIIHLIVGSAFTREFPAKAETAGEIILQTTGLCGHDFADVTLSVRRGEILGLAGISDNGQPEFIRTVAGLLLKSRGTIEINGKSVDARSVAAVRKSGISYLPGDRHREGIFSHLTVRENFTSRSLERDGRYGVVKHDNQVARTNSAIAQFAIKTPDGEAELGQLSGGNQQKVVLASVLASHPSVLLVDEPTQGVDVGARAEIYRILRRAAADGMAIIVLSSDATEVAGLCDSVAVFSRGKVVALLEGDDVTENKITSAVLTSTSLRERVSRKIGRFASFAAGDMAPLIAVGLAILILASVASYQSEFYLSGRNISGMMVLIATLAIVGYAQQLLMLVGGFDLSVGPLMGLVQVIASFYLLADVSASGQALGWGLMLAAALAIGFVNWALVEQLRLHPMVATLATFMGIQAVSLILRPTPGGLISGDVLDAIGTRVAGIPLMFLLAVAIAVMLEFLLFRHRLGFVFRGLGSEQDAARKAGIAPARIRLAAYVGCSFLAFIAGVSMIEQVGIGDPRAGINYTLGSVAVVVIGGGSMFGGRGSFLGALLGAIFIIQVNTVTNFLGLSFEWQSYLLGAATIAAVAFYSKCRQLALAS